MQFYDKLFLFVCFCFATSKIGLKRKLNMHKIRLVLNLLHIIVVHGCGLIIIFFYKLSVKHGEHQT